MRKYFEILKLNIKIYIRRAIKYKYLVERNAATISRASASYQYARIMGMTYLDAKNAAGKITPGELIEPPKTAFPSKSGM